MITVNTFLPRYIKFANQLQQYIVSGEFLPGSKLPSQRELAQQFGTTLMTIRQALNILEDNGLIRTEHGVGTFVMSPHLQEGQFQLLSLSNEMKQRPLGVTETQILSVESDVHHDKARQALKLSENSTVNLLERIRIMNGIPFAYQCSFLPPQLASIALNYTSSSSLYGLLQKETGQALTMAKEYLAPIILSSKQAALLQVKAGEPAWLSVRISSTQDGTAIVYDEAILKCDRFVVTVEHTGRRANCQLKMLDENSPEIFSYLIGD